MPYTFIDTHCHVHFPAYDADREAVLARLREANGGAILIGTSLANGQRAIDLAEKHSNLWATVGLHPSHVTHPHMDDQEGQVDERTVSFEALHALASSSPKVVAIGEAGLDLYRTEAEDRERMLAVPRRSRATVVAEQLAVFVTHLDVAQTLDLPVVIHCREALGELATCLGERRSRGIVDRCVLHSFTGTWAEAEPLIELGCFVALNGIVTFPARKGVPEEAHLARVAERVPLERLLLETDAPYLAPVPHRGERNEPVWTLDTAAYIAHVRGIPLEALLAQALVNTKKLFTRLPF